jgi:hypothetical protein
MPPQNNIPAQSEDRTASLPTRDKTRLKTFVEKVAIAVRLFSKEVHRAKLRWVELRFADYCLGKKGYETRVSTKDHGQTKTRKKQPSQAFQRPESRFLIEWPNRLVSSRLPTGPIPKSA